ncbi:MAG: glycerol-3-phosphate dehydrogenase [Geminicoccaceae bacterium]
MASQQLYDLAIIGGGVNGCGIARDAAGRGLSVYLCEKADLAQGTSSASTKLFHGGLRYLEYYEFRLVREALKEREVLLRAMPHISWPLRFVLPHHKELRPAWLLRLGLFIYDHLGGREILPGTKTLDLRNDPAGAPLKDSFTKGFEYSDCWVEDSRLVVLNAVDARARGASINPRTRCMSARRDGDVWQLTCSDSDGGERTTIRARALVNAGGPWAAEVINGVAGLTTADKIRLVRGSHIVTRKLFDHDRAYIFQNADNRIIFAIPYETDYTLIGTTDAEHDASPDQVVCADNEAEYLRLAASDYFKAAISPDDVVWRYAGVRPLYDDGASSATAATRDYVIKVEARGGAPMVNIFGGKITTYRKLAEAALGKLQPYFPAMGPAWTAGGHLPGGAFSPLAVDEQVKGLRARYGFLDEPWARRLIRAYGTQAVEILGDASAAADLGEHFGATLYAAEVRYLMGHEWARTADDVLWRRSKLGLRVTTDETAKLEAWMRAQRGLGAMAAE